jgi:hypothetical protein
MSRQFRAGIHAGKNDAERDRATASLRVWYDFWFGRRS